MTTDQDALFPIAPVATEQPETSGQKRIRRQAATIATGMHPLALVAGPIRLAPGGKTATKDNAADRPERCGTCQFRQKVGGHSRDFWKCLTGAPTYPNGNVNVSKAPRYSAGTATDVLSWWPACTDYQPEEDSDRG